MISNQARGLAEIANTYGNGEIRLTVWQNLLIPHVRDEDVPTVERELELLGLSCQASSFRAGLVACTGSAGCKFAASDTKRNAMQIAEALEGQFQLETPINIHLTGCHHSCAQHYIGDIGLLGFVCGAEPTRIRFLPPPAITTVEHIDLALELIDQALKLFANRTTSGA